MPAGPPPGRLARPAAHSTPRATFQGLDHKYPCNAFVVPARLAHPVHIKAVELDMTALQRVAKGGVGVIAGRDWHVSRCANSY